MVLALQCCVLCNHIVPNLNLYTVSYLHEGDRFKFKSKYDRRKLHLAVFTIGFQTVEINADELCLKQEIKNR